MFGKSKKFKVQEKYNKHGMSIKVEINDENEKRISLRTQSPNRVITIM